MGSEASGIFPFNHKPVHAVRIGRGFHLGRTEVTLAQFRIFAESTGFVSDAERKGWVQGSRGKRYEKARWSNAPELEPSEDNPVVGVSWRDAVAFCEWLSKETGQIIRLPSEAEWEYACRAGIAEEEYAAHVSDYGWHAGNCRGAQRVGQKQPNAWGLHDMLGNVAEWCQDIWHDTYGGEAPPLDGTAWLPAVSEERVVRGGHWGSGPQVKLLTPYTRQPDKPDHASTQVGFRVVWERCLVEN